MSIEGHFLLAWQFPETYVLVTITAAIEQKCFCELQWFWLSLEVTEIERPI